MTGTKDDRYDLFVKELQQLEFAAVQILRDLSPSNTEELVYSLDYSIIASTLWPNRSRSLYYRSRSVTDEINYVGSQILGFQSKFHEQSEFRLTLSLPTFLEVEKSLLDHSQSLRDVADRPAYAEELRQRLQAIRDGDGEQLLTSTDEMIVRLSDQVASMPLENEINGAAQIIAHLRDGTLASLSDVCGADRFLDAERHSLKQRDTVLAFLKKYRKRKPGESVEEFQFRNLIDATNFVFTNVIDRDDKKHQLSFVTNVPNALRHDQFRSLRNTTRTPFAPFLRLVALELSDAGPGRVTDSLEFIETLLARVAPLVKYLQAVDSLSELGTFKKREVLKFYREMMMPLFSDIKNWKRDINEEREKARSFLDDAGAFRDRFKEASERVDQKAKELKDVTPDILSEEILDFYDLKSDPKVREIYAKLGLD